MSFIRTRNDFSFFLSFPGECCYTRNTFNQRLPRCLAEALGFFASVGRALFLPGNLMLSLLREERVQNHKMELNAESFRWTDGDPFQKIAWSPAEQGERTRLQVQWWKWKRFRQRCRASDRDPHEGESESVSVWVGLSEFCVLCTRSLHAASRLRDPGTADVKCRSSVRGIGACFWRCSTCGHGVSSMHHCEQHLPRTWCCFAWHVLSYQLRSSKAERCGRRRRLALLSGSAGWAWKCFENFVASTNLLISKRNHASMHGFGTK